MKKRRLMFLVVNLVAVLAALGSVFLPWWQGDRPSDIALTDILPLDFLNNFGFTPNVVVIVFLGAAIIAIGALLAFKWLVLIGAAVNILTIEMWFLAFDIAWKFNQPFGHGLYLLAASVIIAILSLIIPKRRREGKR